MVVGFRMHRLAPYLTLAVTLGAVITHVALVPPLAEGVAASPEAQERIGERIRRKEPKMRRHALERFPGNPWSAADDFGNEEENFVRDMSNEEGARPGAVLDAIDRDVKSFPGDGERGSVAPCMPRPFYD